MRRHPALVPLSHHHHRALVTARRTRRAAAAPPGEQIVAAREFLEFFDGHAIEHFRDEEERAFPLLLADGAEPPEELGRALLEHARLHAFAHELRAALAAGVQPTDTLLRAGELLESHVRLEERQLFPMIEKRAASLLADGLPSARSPGDSRHGERSPVVDLALPTRGRGPQWGMRSIDLNATLLAWPAGAGFAEHRNRERDVLVVVLEGSAELTLDGLTHVIGPHELMLLPRESARALTAGSVGVRYLSIHLRREPLLPRSR